MKVYLKTDAITLRRRGYSFAMLSDRLGISKSTASLWTRDVKLSPVGQERLNKRKKQGTLVAAEISHAKKEKRLFFAENEAKSLINRSDKSELTILAILFECEGCKSGTCLRFTNADPSVITLFMSVFRKSFILDESKFRVLVHIHDYHNDQKIRKYWSSVTKIPVGKFLKSYKKKSLHAYKKKGYMGCANIYYYDAHVFRVIRAFAKEVTKLYI